MKQQKARRAHKRRVARQTRRERKSRQQPRLLASVITHFHRFPDLPLELREMIWDECIPSRLVIPRLESSDGPYADPPPTSLQRPPMISQVCHEARRVALRHGSLIRVERFRRMSLWSRFSYDETGPDALHDYKVWFDTRKDTFSFSRTGYLEQGSRSPCWTNMSMEAISAVRASGRFGCLRNHRESIFDEPTTEIVSSEWLQKADVAYVVEGYCLRASLSAAIDSGLFGLFGESRAIMVDLDDIETFRRLKNLGTGLSWNCQWIFPFVDPHDIKKVPEITQNEIPEHGRAWWLFQRFCNKARRNTNNTTFPEFEQFCKGRQNFRLVALVILDLDPRRRLIELRSRLSSFLFAPDLSSFNLQGSH